LELWDKTLKDTKSPPFLSLDSLDLQLDPRSMAKDFPDELEVGPTSRLQLSYRFEPGSELDGVTLEVPESFVEQLHQEKLEWLVPGLLEEKLAALLKSLPKPLRRQFVPIPDTVKSLLPKMLDAASRSEPFWRSLCDICSKHIGQPVQRADFNPSSLPEHLRFRIELKDNKGNNLAVAREWTAIQQNAQVQLDSKPKADRPANAPATNYPWQRSQMQAWDIPELPKKIIELNGGVRMERYPSLLWNDAKVSTTIYDLPHLAEQQLRETMVRSLAIQERRELKSQIQFLPKWTQCTLWLSDRFDANKLTDFVAQLMVRLALVETNWTKDSGRFEPSPRTLLDWEARRVGKVQKIGAATVELARWLPKFAEAYQQIRRLKESLPKPLWEQSSSLRAQLDGLMDPAHAMHTPWLFVKDIPRFLNALALRIEKLRTSGTPKDQQTDLAPAEAFQDYSKRIAELESQLAVAKHKLHWYPDGTLLDYRWMIEEFRVSIHAQKLGTRMSVSPKRIEKLQEQLRTESI
jgi:ATP-dependent helicase HrpA